VRERERERETATDASMHDCYSLEMDLHVFVIGVLTDIDVLLPIDVRFNMNGAREISRFSKHQEMYS
jgi:hypothetical protein